ncbi:MAG: S-layer homology domain-containing protein, partial [Oscillospiraceae bacterium]|nr:S-layer homology domain-containing protein [Oscillospiraceae bacterium]
ENGVSDGTNLNGNVTREQLATMLWRFAGKPSAPAAEVNFTDAGDISAWAREAVAWAVSAGIITGYPDGSVKPAGHATRAEVATMIERYIKV